VGFLTFFQKKKKKKKKADESAPIFFFFGRGEGLGENTCSLQPA